MELLGFYTGNVGKVRLDRTMKNDSREYGFGISKSKIKYCTANLASKGRMKVNEIRHDCIVYIHTFSNILAQSSARMV